MLNKMTFSEALPVALLGILIVLLALAALAVIFRLLGAASGRKKAEPAATAEARAEKDVPAIPAGPREIRYDCDDKTAAILMAIVCDKLQKSPDELWFKSIKRKEQ